jgi:hypothetical protein
MPACQRHNVVHEQPWLQICAISLAEIGISHVKKFHANFGAIQRGVAGWFDITLEPNAYPQYYGWWRSISLLFVFQMFIILWSKVATRLVTLPLTCCYWGSQQWSYLGCVTPSFMAKPNAHSMCAQESNLHTYCTENGYSITNVTIYNIYYWIMSYEGLSQTLSKTS